jgi:hypothetical protein
MKYLKISLPYFELLIGLIPIIPIASLFPTGEFLTQNGHLTGFLDISIILAAFAAFLDHVSKTTPKCPSWFFVLYSNIAFGVGSGFSLGALLVLDAWYANPDNGTWEPLFTATGLCGASAVAIGKYVESMNKRRQDL